ncbi:ATP-binding cassette domain-containing protein, partial [Amycolatopsis sacchari]|uniref:ATP-binding cassette domain-containing protein n=1 Tax=Amycolatopsis sacchari TaxID=115433 RepID=UPI003EB97C2D
MNTVAASQPLLDIRGLTVEFPAGRGRPPLRALDQVHLHVDPGETVGIVGESGSGKTTLGRAVLGLVDPTAGKIGFDGTDITHARGRQRRLLSADLQVVFQDPYSSLNPTRTIGRTLAETLLAHRRLPRDVVEEYVTIALERVGLDHSAGNRYPSQFSGGQRQRIAIARALIPQPKLVICDEPVSALDLSVQAQVLNLLRRLQADLSLSYLFIAHDLAVVRYLASRTVVLYRGRIMEEGPSDTLYQSPRHPYTQALLAAAPEPDPSRQRVRRRSRQRYASPTDNPTT